MCGRFMKARRKAVAKFGYSNPAIDNNKDNKNNEM